MLLAPENIELSSPKHARDWLTATAAWSGAGTRGCRSPGGGCIAGGRCRRGCSRPLFGCGVKSDRMNDPDTPRSARRMGEKSKTREQGICETATLDIYVHRRSEKKCPAQGRIPHEVAEGRGGAAGQRGTPESFHLYPIPLATRHALGHFNASSGGLLFCGFVDAGYCMHDNLRVHLKPARHLNSAVLYSSVHPPTTHRIKRA